MLTANIVGVGKIGFEFELDELRPKPVSHIGTIKQLPEHIQLTGICDLSRNKQLAAQMFYENKDTECFTSYTKMFREKPADILVIATLPNNHFEVVSDAIYSSNPPKLIFCLPPTQMISSADGLKQIKDIKIGDKVLTHKGRYRKVLNIFKRNFNGNLVKVRTKCGNSEEFDTITTPEHEYFTCLSKSTNKGRVLQQIVKIRADELKTYLLHKSNQYIIYPRITEIKDIKVISDEIKYYRKLKIVNTPVNNQLMTIIGYYLAEGHVVKIKKYGLQSVVFSFGYNLNEYSYAGELVDALLSLGYTAHLYRVGTSLRVQVCSTKLARFLEKHFKTGASNKMVPAWIKLLPKNKLSVLLECYFKGDGTQRIRRPRGTLSKQARTVSLQLAIDVRDIASKVGYVASLSSWDGEPTFQDRKINVKRIYIISCTENMDSTIRNDSNHVYLAIKSINHEYYSGVVYDLEVEEDHSFCTPYHTISNCEKPLAGDTIIAEKMVEICKNNNVILAVNHSRRWEEAWILTKNLSTDLGGFTFHGRFSGRIDHVGIHMCDLAVWFKGSDTFITHHPLFNYLIFEVDLIGENGRIIIRDNGRVVELYKPRKSFYYSDISELIREFKTTFSYDKVSKPDTPIYRAYNNIIRHLNNNEPLNCSGENGLEAMYALDKFMGI